MTIYKRLRANPLQSFCHFYIVKIQYLNFKGVHVMNNFLSVVLFNTKKHTDTIGDMITLTSAMTILCSVVFVSLIVGIK